MKLMTLPQYMKMSKPALIRKITKALRAMPKAKLARLCYNITKAKLPRLRKTRRKVLQMKGKYSTKRERQMEFYPFAKQAFEARRDASRTRPYFEVKKKRKFSKKQLAAQRLFAKRARAGTLRKRRRR